MEEADNFDQGKAVMHFALKDFNRLGAHYYNKHPHATGAAMLTVTRDIYVKAYGAETAAMMFYRLADELAVSIPKKYI